MANYEVYFLKAVWIGRHKDTDIFVDVDSIGLSA
jgi:hypothetical protein